MSASSSPANSRADISAATDATSALRPRSRAGTAADEQAAAIGKDRDGQKSAFAILFAVRQHLDTGSGYYEAWQVQTHRNRQAARLRRRLLRLSRPRHAVMEAAHAARRSMPTARPFFTQSQNHSTRRPTMANAGAGRWCRPRRLRPTRTAEMRFTFANFSRTNSTFRPWPDYSAFSRWRTKRRERPVRRQDARRRRNDRPAWPPASSASNCPTNSTSSRFSSNRWPMQRPAAASSRSRQLAQIFENRQQYDRAAEYWKSSIAEYGPDRKNRKQRGSIRSSSNWGTFEPLATQAAGHRRHRLISVSATARRSVFEAHEINVAKLLDDVKAYLKTKPKPARLAAAQHRQHRLSPRGEESEAISRREGAPGGIWNSSRATSTSTGA